MHHWEFKSNVEGYVVNFTDSFFNNQYSNISFLNQFAFFSGYGEEQVIQLKGDANEEVVSLFEKILEEKKRLDNLHSEMIRTLLVQLFVTVSRNKGQRMLLHSNKHGQVTLHNFKKLVDQQYTRHRLPREYARQLYITPNYLNNLTNDLMGKSAGEVVRDRIILEAKRLLINADLTITEIATQLNFEDKSYFTKFFKKYVLLTPERFRVKYQMRT